MRIENLQNGDVMVRDIEFSIIFYYTPKNKSTLRRGNIVKRSTDFGDLCFSRKENDHLFVKYYVYTVKKESVEEAMEKISNTYNIDLYKFTENNHLLKHNDYIFHYPKFININCTENDYNNLIINERNNMIDEILNNI